MDASCLFSRKVVLFTQTMPAVKLYPVQTFVSNIISIPGVEGGVTNKGIIGVSGCQDAFEDLP